MCSVTLLPLVLISLACARIIFLLPDQLVLSALRKTVPAEFEPTLLVNGFKFFAAGIISIVVTELPGATSKPAGSVLEDVACWIVAEMFRTIWQGCG